MQSSRLGKLPPYLFVEIDRRKSEFARSGGKVLDLGIGDPDIGAPEVLRDLLGKALENREYDRYPSDRGLPELIEAIRKWALKEHRVELSPDEILVTIGSKEAIAHLPLAVVDPGDIVLVPDPGYPVYSSSAIFAGGRPVTMPLLRTNDFLPDLESIGADISSRSRIMYLNYPNNPTSATAPPDFFGRMLEYCGKNDCILVNDAAYYEIFYEGRAEALFPSGRESGVPYIEFFSFSKTFSITGWRIGFAIGSPEVISALGRLKANIDSGVFSAVQAAVAGLLDADYQPVIDKILAVYRERRDILADGLRKAGIEFDPPESTFYFWIPVPGGEKSIDFCGRLLDDTGIVATPGVGFGQAGEGYFRLSITAPTDTIRQAGEKLAGFR
ncbi:MAG: aminotransferase class I/II-fold pyridoxal phosphate-dependent enzyme [Candidatus Krumholzibacteria bacterium]|nr:aminotransferase class I/II-fold pyridoxal phosphate-dependent enzyme [Candidatus Krumholzibacteria bacterium]